MTPAGDKYPVRHKNSKSYYNNLKTKYLEKYKFEHAADLDALHELIMCHLSIYECSEDLAKDSDLTSSHKVHETIMNYKKQIVALQDSLCISAKSRDKGSERADVAEYIKKLLQRAQYFNMSREEQYTKAKQIINEIKALLRMDKVCNDEEKRVVGIMSPQALLKKIGEMIKEYDKIDEPVKKEQKEWGIGGDEW